MLPQGSTPERQPEHLLKPMREWAHLLDELHGDSLEPRYTEAITGYLHDAGILYHIKDQNNAAVMLDQSWAAEIIYDMLRPPGNEHDDCLFNRIRKKNGLFSSDDLEESKPWCSIETEASKALLLAYIQSAGLFIRVLGRENSRRDDEDLYLATEKWLLRDYTWLKLGVVYDHIRDGAGSEQEHFSFEKTELGEFDFRRLMAHIGRRFGLQSTFFRNGVHVTDGSTTPQWCFEAKWQPLDEFAYFGRVDVRLAAPAEQLETRSQQMADLFLEAGSPLHGQSIAPLPSADIETFRRWSIYEDQSDYDMAISSSGGDGELVQPLYDQLTASGYKVKWYKERQGKPLETILELMKSLAQQKVLLIVASDEYMSSDPNNFYCLFELADALRGLEEGERDFNKTFVLYKKDVDENQLVERKNLLPKMEAAFDEMFSHFTRESIDESNRNNRKDYSWLAHVFSSASASAILGKFSEQCGWMGKSPWITKHDKGYDFSVLIEEIQRVVK